MNDTDEPKVEQAKAHSHSLPWVKCKTCKRTITLPPEWRTFRVDLGETARIVLSVHQKRCF